MSLPTPPFSDHHIVHADCLKVMSTWPEACVDLVFADPPFNIGYRYDGYDDRRRYDDYVNWTRDWMAAAARLLKPTGSLYVAIGDAYAAEVRLAGRALSLPLRNWIIWNYTFGQNMRSRFSLSHTHILYFVRDERRHTFNADAVRFPSARHTEYADRRANPLGRLPDDVWNEFPRVCGTFSERQGWHGCQMPEQLLMRIVRVSSNPRDVVLDPFVGSGTTAVAAAKLGRVAIGIDTSATYAAEARRRLTHAIQYREQARHAQQSGEWSAFEIDCLKQLYRDTETPFASLAANPVAMKCFAACMSVRTGLTRTPAELLEQLSLLDGRNLLPRFKNDRPFKPRTHRAQTCAPDRKLKAAWFVGLPASLRDERVGNKRPQRRRRGHDEHAA